MPRSLENRRCVIRNPLTCEDSQEPAAPVAAGWSLNPIGWLRGEVIEMRAELCSVKRDIVQLEIHQQDFDAWRHALTAY